MRTKMVDATACLPAGRDSSPSRICFASLRDRPAAFATRLTGLCKWWNNYTLCANLFRKELKLTRRGETIDWGNGFALPRLFSRPQEDPL